MANPLNILTIKGIQPTLKAFALSLTKDHTDAEDLVQDTMYKAHRYQHQYKPETNLQAWLLTIMRNTFINDWRRRRRAQDLQNTPVAGVVVLHDKHVDNSGESAATLEELTGLINRLDDTLRHPFLMAYQGFKYEEIAEEMGVPLGTIKSRIHQARLQLRDMVTKLYQTKRMQDLVSSN